MHGRTVLEVQNTVSDSRKKWSDVWIMYESVWLLMIVQYIQFPCVGRKFTWKEYKLQHLYYRRIQGTGRTGLGCPQERVWAYNYWEFNFRAR